MKTRNNKNYSTINKVKIFFTNKFSPYSFLIGIIVFIFSSIFIHKNPFELSSSTISFTISFIISATIGTTFLIITDKKDETIPPFSFPWFPLVNILPSVLTQNLTNSTIAIIYWIYFVALMVYCYIISIEMSEKKLNLITLTLTLWIILSGFVTISLRYFSFGEKALSPIIDSVNFIIDIRIILSAISISIFLFPAFIKAYKIVLLDLDKREDFLSDFLKNTPLEAIVEAGNTLIWVFILITFFLLQTIKILFIETKIALKEYTTLLKSSISLFLVFLIQRPLTYISDLLANAGQMGTCIKFQYSNFEVLINSLIIIGSTTLILFWVKKEKYFIFITTLLYGLCYICFSSWAIIGIAYISSSFLSINMLPNYSCPNLFLVTSTLFILICFTIIYTFVLYKGKKIIEKLTNNPLEHSNSTITNNTLNGKIINNSGPFKSSDARYISFRSKFINNVALIKKELSGTMYVRYLYPSDSSTENNLKGDKCCFINQKGENLQFSFDIKIKSELKEIELTGGWGNATETTYTQLGKYKIEFWFQYEDKKTATKITEINFDIY